MFNVGILNRIKLTKGDNASFHLNVYNEDGTPYKMESGDVLTLTVNGQFSLDADSDSYFSFTPELTEDVEGFMFPYDIQLTTSDGQNYTLISSFIELLEQSTVPEPTPDPEPEEEQE